MKDLDELKTILTKKGPGGRPEMTDRAFDKAFPEWIRNLSAIHWTPVTSAMIAAEFACKQPRAKILDVGSGCGKFCIIGASITSGQFYGVEQRKPLVDCANRIANGLSIERARFIHQNAMDLDWNQFDSIYIFNPFSENLDDSIKIDDEVELTSHLYVKYIQTTQRKLHYMPAGTRVVTLNGFGGDFPPGYSLVHHETLALLDLMVWDKL